MQNQETKICIRCKKEKYLRDFYHYTSCTTGKTRVDCYCKECRKEVNSKQYRRKVKERRTQEQILRDSVSESESYCLCCKRVLPVENFYKVRKTGKPYHYCRECCHERNTSRIYKSVARKGVYRSDIDGRLYVLEGRQGGAKIFWNGNMLYLLKTYYPCTRNDELAELIGVSLDTICSKAKELGLKKSPQYIHACKVRAGRSGGITTKRKNQP